ncbi:MAG TPA: hypothetical protein VNJ02_19630 [Vicinamibacterales bacterium]|nr:hypothetical protein [Vicinamibacterales bacterium]
MKNRTTRFTSGTHSLTISLRKGQAGIKTSVRHRTPEAKPQIGCKNYFELTDEAKAQESFDALVADAVTNGWTRTAKAERTPSFTAIPHAPTATLNAVRARR